MNYCIFVATPLTTFLTYPTFYTLVQRYSNTTTLLLLLLAGFVLYQFWQNKTLISAQNTIKEQLDAANLAQQHLRDQVALLKDSDTQAIALTDGGAHSKAVTYLYYNKTRQEAAIDIGGVPAPPPDKVNWLWALQEGKFVPIAPLANTAVGSWQKLPFLDNVEKFMIAVGNEKNTSTIPELVIFTSN
jgi:hypothetical protein